MEKLSCIDDMKAAIPLCLAAFLVQRADAGPRTSANYSITTEIADAGGRRATSANYTHDGGLGGVAGISSVVAPAEAAKQGYIGQLYEITGLALNAASLNVNEGTTDQLAAWQALDDATFLAVPAASVVWSVASGPLTGLSASGLATAGIVFQDTAATAQGSYLGTTGTLALTVKNVNLDDYGTYAADGIDDAWQNQYFGLNNPNAGPAVDFDGTGQTNLFKYIAGLNPLDPNSRFTLAIAPVAGQPGQKAIVFAPRLTDRTYTVTFKTDLGAASWTPVAGATFTDAGPQRTVTDPAATDAKKFYHVEITKP